MSNIVDFSDFLNEKKKKGLWDNMRAKAARGEKPARKGSKAFKKAVAAAKEINEDHEVSMTVSLLDDIIKNATELKAKIGEVEMDIPAWCQDHISQAQNFINQANTGFDEK